MWAGRQKTKLSGVLLPGRAGQTGDSCGKRGSSCEKLAWGIIGSRASHGAITRGSQASSTITLLTDIS